MREPQSVILMRGLPCCGKSTTAQQLIQSGGIVLETDEYFLTQAGTNNHQYDYDELLLPDARAWNLVRYQQALLRQSPLIIVDRGNGLNDETYQYVKLALDKAYHIRFHEPLSPWWQEIRILLKNKQYNYPLLKQWSERLSLISRQQPPYHCIPAPVIFDLMKAWRAELTIRQLIKKFA